MMATGPVRVNLTSDTSKMEDARRRWVAMQRRHEWERRHPVRSRWLRLRSVVANRLLGLGERILP